MIVCFGSSFQNLHTHTRTTSFHSHNELAHRSRRHHIGAPPTECGELSRSQLRSLTPFANDPTATILLKCPNPMDTKDSQVAQKTSFALAQSRTGGADTLCPDRAHDSFATLPICQQLRAHMHAPEKMPACTSSIHNVAFAVCLQVVVSSPFPCALHMLTKRN